MRPLTPVPVAAARIFGTRIGNYAHRRSGGKVLRRKLRGPTLADYYREPLAKARLTFYADAKTVNRHARAERLAKRQALKANAGRRR